MLTRCKNVANELRFQSTRELYEFSPRFIAEGATIDEPELSR